MPRVTNELTESLTAIWIAAGRPTTRAIATRTVPRVGHTSVWGLLAGTNKAPSRWETVETIVRAMGGNPAEIYPLWQRAVRNDAESRALLGKPRSTHLPADTDASANVLSGITDLAAAINNLADAIRGRAPSD